MKNLLKFSFVLSLICIIFSCNSENVSTEKSAKYRGDVEKVFNMFATGNTEGVENFVDANYNEHTPPPGIDVKGVEGFKKIIKMNHDAIPDIKMTIINYMEQGDMVTIHYNMKGTNTGEMGPGMPATNKPVDCDGVDILKFANGKCTDHWGYFEEMKFMTQLGMMPPMDMSAPPADKAAAPAEVKK